MSDTDRTPDPTSPIDLSAVTTDNLVAELSNRGSSGGVVVLYSADDATGNLTYHPFYWGRLPDVLFVLGKVEHSIYAATGPAASAG